MQQKTNIEKYIEAFVSKEKQLSSSPFLATRIMAAIEAKSQRITLLLKRSITVVSLLMIISIGISLIVRNNPEETIHTEIIPDDYTIENYAYLFNTH